MICRFRKIFTLGLFQTTWTGKGMGWSFGLPGCRVVFSARGGIHITIGIPCTGFYFTKKLFRTRSPDVDAYVRP